MGKRYNVVPSSTNAAEENGIQGQIRKCQIQGCTEKVPGYTYDI